MSAATATISPQVIGSGAALGQGPADRPLRTEGLLDCPVCMEFLHGHVHQCMAGHVICVRCYSRLEVKRCPSCKTMFPPIAIRNRAIERISEQAITLGLVARPEAVRDELPRVQRRSTRYFTFENQSRGPKVRHGVTCDGPQCLSTGKGLIEGIRFTCAECHPCYDLCDDCALDGHHGHHLLIRLANPSHSRQVEKAKTGWRAARLAAAGEPQESTQDENPPERRILTVRRVFRRRFSEPSPLDETIASSSTATNASGSGFSFRQLFGFVRNVFLNAPADMPEAGAPAVPGGGEEAVAGINGANGDGSDNEEDGGVSGDENDMELEGDEDDLDSEGDENDLDLEGEENDLDLEGDENDLDSEGDENDLDLEGEENDLDLEGDEDDLGLERDENDLGLEGDEDILGLEGDEDFLGLEGDEDIQGLESDDAEDDLGVDGDEDNDDGEEVEILRED